MVTYLCKMVSYSLVELHKNANCNEKKYQGVLMLQELVEMMDNIRLMKGIQMEKY